MKQSSWQDIFGKRGILKQAQAAGARAYKWKREGGIVYPLVDGRLFLFWDHVAALFPPGMISDMFSAYTRLVHRLASEPDATMTLSIRLKSATPSIA